jgi:hypothetical protein
MLKTIFKISVSIFLVIFLLSLTAVPVLAFDTRSGTNVTIGSGETVNGDVYLFGTNITIEGTVNGDVFAAGQTIRINGTINGGVSLAGQTVTLNGKISNGARVAGQTISVGANIGRDLVMAGSDIEINNSAVIGKDVNSVSSSAIIKGKVTGNVSGSYNNLTIADGIDGDVIVTVNNLLIDSTANIRGKLNYTSDNNANVQSGSNIAGSTTRTTPSREEPARGVMAGIIGGLLFRIFSFLAIFVIGLVLLFVLRRYFVSLALTIADHPVSTLGWGALLVFVTPLAALVVIVTIIGIPLGLISLVIWAILLYLSQIPVALLIGWLILSRRRETFSYGFLVGLLALGLAVLCIITAIPVLGFLIWLFALIFGMGSLISVFHARPKIAPTVPPP